MSIAVMTRRQDMIDFLRDHSKKPNTKIGFVPTMGALHAGHTTLIAQSASENQLTVVSVFVNPKQFGPQEDLSKYPRQFRQDCDLCQAHGAHVVFAPTVEEMYPPGFATQVSVPTLNRILCGEHRPGHFDGVATVVALLLNIVRPDRSYFGQKDYQQVQIIRRLCLDMGFPTKIVMVKTIREADGLALSSRNVYLTPEARVLAQAIPQALGKAAKLYCDGERKASVLRDCVLAVLKAHSLVPQYAEIRLAEDLSQRVEGVLTADCVFALAQLVPSGEISVRLIDNIILSEDSEWMRCLEELSHVHIPGDSL